MRAIVCICVRACARACECMRTFVCMCARVRAFAGVNVCQCGKRKKIHEGVQILSGQIPKFETVDSFDLSPVPVEYSKNLLFGNLTYQCNAKLSPLADGHRDFLGPGGLGRMGCTNI